MLVTSIEKTNGKFKLFFILDAFHYTWRAPQMSFHGVGNSRLVCPRGQSLGKDL